jgi:hypothetical protein
MINLLKPKKEYYSYLYIKVCENVTIQLNNLYKNSELITSVDSFG